MSVDIQYKQRSPESAECSIRIGESAITLYPSFLSDGLAELVIATNRMLESGEGEAKLQDEPGEWRVKLTRLPGGEQARILVLAFAESWSTQLDEAGETLFDETARLRTLAGAVLSSAQRLLESAEYENAYHSYPITEVRRLRENLRPSKGLA